MEDRSDDSIGRWCGWIVGEGCETVATRPSPPKNLQSDIVTIAVLEVDMADDRQQANERYITPLDIS